MSTLREILRSLRFLVARRSVERDLDDELRFHIEMQSRGYVDSGMTPSGAHARAQREFGRVSAVKDALRDVHVAPLHARALDALGVEARHAWRALARSPGFAISVVATFAIGIGANATMVSLIDRLLVQPPAHVRAVDRLVELSAHWRFDGREMDQKSFPYFTYSAMRRSLPAAERVAMTTYAQKFPLGTGVGARSVSGLLVSASYFPMLGVHPQLGRFFGEDEDVTPQGASVVVIGDALWRGTLGGTADVIGRQLEIGPRRYTVVGVAPPGFTGLELGIVDIWVPVTAAQGLWLPSPDWATTRRSTWLRIVARLKPGMTAPQLAAQATPVNLEAGEPRMAGMKASIVATPMMRALREQRGESGRVALLLGVVSALVLAIACANVANLMLARAVRGRRETAVRLSLGISRGRFIAQMLMQSVMLGVAGGAAALVVAAWGVQTMRALLFSDVQWATSALDARGMIYTALLALGCGVLAGLAPALNATRADLSTALKAGAREGGGRRPRAQTAILVAQGALAVVLLAGTGLFAKSLGKVLGVHIGMEPDRALLATMRLASTGRSREEQDRLMREMETRIRALPGIEAAAAAVTVPGWGSWGAKIFVPGGDTASASAVNGPFLNAVRPGFFAAMGTRIVRGRDFTDGDDASAARVAIVNETAARLWFNGGDPLGRCIRIVADTAPCAEIIGVSENSRRQNWIEKPIIHVHVPLGQSLGSVASLIVVRPSGDLRAAARRIRQTMQSTAPDLPFAEVRTLASLFTDELRPWRLGAAMFGAFGCLAVLLAAVGLYGVIAFGVAQRTHEIGVRIALGAQAGRVLRLILSEALKIALVSGAVGLAIAFAAAPRVAGLLFDVSPRDPVVLIGTLSVLFVVSIAAALVPAWRAVRVDPAIALRSD